MMKQISAISVLTAAALLWPSTIVAQEVARIHRVDGVTLMVDITSTDSISLNADRTAVEFHLGQTVGTVPISQISLIDFGPAVTEVQVSYGADGPTVVNPYAFRGVEVTIGANNQVQVTSALSTELTYALSGTGTGSFKLYSAARQQIRFDGLQLTSVEGPAVNVQSKKKTTVALASDTDNRLVDAATYDLTSTEDQKGAFFSEGQLVFTGEGSLALKGNYKHALCSDDYIRIESGNVTVEGAVGDGVHSNDSFRMQGGTLTVRNAESDCIDGDAGIIEISGGKLTLTAAAADTKALKCDSTLTVSGGEIDVTLSGNQTKGLKSGKALRIDGGALTFNCSGGVVVTDGDPSYCTAIKSDSTLTITGGTVNIVHTGSAGKGISADQLLTISGGTITATMSGNGGTYTNASGQSDTYSSTAVKSDAALFIQAGTLTLSNSGTGGKCVTADGILTIGDETHVPEITARTTGSAISGSSSSGGGGWQPGGGRPGGGGPGGDQSSGSGGKPKAIKGASDVVIENGNLTVSTTSDGGEGIESKSALTVNGGTIDAQTYDDALQASSRLTINGGKIYAYASGNDGIDCNGPMTINGGLVFSTGTNQPEEGFDCDQYTFAINGGTLVGIGGASSTPSGSSSQCSALLSGTSVGSGTRYTLTNSSGTPLVSFVAPRQLNSATLLLSSPSLTQGSTYTLYSGGSVSGGTAFHGITPDASSYTKGTQLKQFTASSRVTSVR